MIKGLGVDLVSVKRMEEVVARHGERLLQRVFTPQELQYCMRKRFPIPHLASRWAIKEAFFKAMGMGWGQGLRWREVELKGGVDLPPQVVLQGGTKKKAEEMGISQVWASLSHEKEFAVSTVLLAGRTESATPSREGIRFR
jgi:holo-[acyl-carrier protein] synthase